MADPKAIATIHDEVLIEGDGKEYSWNDIKITLGGIPFPRAKA